jgi:hypothetical protein
MQLAPRLYNIAPHEIDDLIRDVAQEQLGARVYYALDSHDLFDFCFPVNPLSPALPDIDRIAEDQASFHEVFFARSVMPILLPEYSSEFKHLMSYLAATTDKVYTTMEMLEPIIKAAGLDTVAADSERQMEKVVETSFNALLAVAMGLHSLGLDRLRSLFREPLLSARIETDDRADESVIRRIEQAYTEGPLVNYVFGVLEREHHAVARRQSRANITDARAIDWLLYMNSALEGAYLDGRLPRRYLILYLSSARRSRSIMQQPEVRRALPHIDGQPYGILRTSRQVFAYLVHKSTAADGGRRADETTKNLTSLRALVQQMAKLDKLALSPGHCETCVLTGGRPEQCALIDYCKSVRWTLELFSKTRKAIDNLGLLKNVNDYKRWLDASREAKARSDTSRSAGPMELFANICRSRITDVAMERMYQKRQFMLIDSEVAGLFTGEFEKHLSGPPHANPFRSPKDHVVGIDDYLPTNPRLPTPRYQTILRPILAYLKDPAHTDGVEDAYRAFLEDDSTEREDGERELVRCYLYLAFGAEEGDEKAYHRLNKLVAAKETVSSNSLLELECVYFMCWAARRTGRFVQADSLFREGIEKWPDDPRLYHGRSLNIFSWMMNQDYAPACPYSTSQASTDAERAILLYGARAQENHDVIAACYNNLCYFLAHEAIDRTHSLGEGRAKLPKAREALDTLKTLVKKEDWYPAHPEYFYTEAYLEYQELLMTWATEDDKGSLRFKMEHVRANINLAVQLHPTERSYYELEASIDGALERLWMR